MKKTAIFFISIILLFIFSIGSFAASKGELTVSDVSGKPGETVAVEISLKNNPGIIAIRLDVDYDSSKVDLVEVADGKLLGNGNSTFNNNINTVPYTLLWEDATATENHTENGVLATLKFRISDSATGGNVDIKVNIDAASTFDKDLNEIDFSVSDGSIGITAKNDHGTKVSQAKTEKETPQAAGNALRNCSHSKTEWITFKNPTCSEEGRKKAVCLGCNLIIRVEDIKTTEHKMSGWEAVPDSDYGTSAEFRGCDACGYREIKTNGKEVSVYNDPADPTPSLPETTVSSQPQMTPLHESSESPSDFTSDPQNSTLTVAFVVALLLTAGSVLLIVLKLKKEKDSK